MSAPTPTYGDGVALQIDHPSLSWMQHDLPTIVEMAELQPHESVLVVACETGQLILEIVRASNGNHGRMVGVEDSRLAVQLAIQKLDTLGLMQDMRLLCGDPYQLDTINDLDEATEGHSHTTFDIILARNALPPHSSQYTSILRHWTTFLTPTSGRMVVTFSPCDNDNPYLAGVQAVVGDGEVLTRMSWLLEAEWVELEDRFRALAREAGLVVERLERLVLQGADTIKMGEQMEDGARDAGYELKQDYLWDALEALAPEMKASTLAGLAAVVGEARYLQVEATLQLVPVTAKLAAVLKSE